MKKNVIKVACGVALFFGIVATTYAARVGAGCESQCFHQKIGSTDPNAAANYCDGGKCGSVDRSVGSTLAACCPSSGTAPGGGGGSN